MNSEPSKKEEKVVLIVDDLDLFRTILGDALSAEGYTVDRAPDGQLAIEKIKEFKGSLALLVLDLQMPKADGFEVLEEINRLGLRGEFPILVITGAYEDAQSISIVRQLGADGFISKSDPPEFLMARIRQAIHGF